MKNKLTIKADLLGIMASLTCAVHCSVLPLAIAYGFLGSSYMLGHGFVEMIFIFLSISVAVYALWGSYARNHRNPLPLVSFTIGIICIVIALINHGNIEIVLATLGGLIIAFAHLINMRLNKVQLKNIF
jgi:hypothetical protein